MKKSLVLQISLIEDLSSDNVSSEIQSFSGISFTIIVTSSYVNIFNEEFELLHENLKKVKILFEDPILASKHLNKIWKNVDNWWESGDVKIAREIFFKEVALVEPNPFEKWKKFLHNL